MAGSCEVLALLITYFDYVCDITRGYIAVRTVHTETGDLRVVRQGEQRTIYMHVRGSYILFNSMHFIVMQQSIQYI